MSSPKNIKVTIDGKDVPGIQEVKFTVSRNRQQNIYSPSVDERIGTYYGSLHVSGTLTTRSLFADLDNKLYEPIAEAKPFQMIIEFDTQGSDQHVRKIPFDECFLEDMTFGMDAQGVGLATYNFTATRLREE
jgi:hypothetical protein